MLPGGQGTLGIPSSFARGVWSRPTNRRAWTGQLLTPEGVSLQLRSEVPCCHQGGPHAAIPLPGSHREAG